MQTGPHQLVFVGGLSAGTSTLYRPGLNTLSIQVQEPLGRGAQNDDIVGQVEVRPMRYRRYGSQPLIEGPLAPTGRLLDLRLEPMRQVDLVDVSGGYVLLGAMYSPHVGVPTRVGPEVREAFLSHVFRTF